MCRGWRAADQTLSRTVEAVGYVTHPDTSMQGVVGLQREERRGLYYVLIQPPHWASRCWLNIHSTVQPISHRKSEVTEVLTCCMEDGGQGTGLEVGRVMEGDCTLVMGQGGGGGVIR